MSRIFASASILCQSAAALLVTVAALPACSTKDKEPKPYDATCVDAQDPEQLKCTDYVSAPGATEGPYADSCAAEGGTWTKGRLCEVESGTRGCRSDLGFALTTWYLGAGYAHTDIACGDQATLVTK
jgi:hypothetical protein